MACVRSTFILAKLNSTICLLFKKKILFTKLGINLLKNGIFKEYKNLKN